MKVEVELTGKTKSALKASIMINTIFEWVGGKEQVVSTRPNELIGLHWFLSSNANLVKRNPFVNKNNPAPWSEEMNKSDSTKTAEGERKGSVWK